MGQPVKVSDDLLMDARVMAEATQRSIAGQIEFWAGLGRTIERLLRGDQILALSKAGKVRPLSASVKEIESAAGRKGLSNYLKSLPYPHYEAAPGSSNLLIRTESGGKRTIGKFINRKFRPISKGKP